MAAVWASRRHTPHATRHTHSLLQHSLQVVTTTCTATPLHPSLSRYSLGPEGTHRLLQTHADTRRLSRNTATQSYFHLGEHTRHIEGTMSLVGEGEGEEALWQCESRGTVCWAALGNTSGVNTRLGLNDTLLPTPPR
ncbi:hypothetical protein E2C01_084145 [Portunus trituberculatus]|uniref:Uncharacterized protein n=1 Tax=Portunus trituberculatus TaxID=210409 RepID=A0A5B7J3H8_PORTR|nr:hypothetical protein [Portunus trituberculatus]